jgi:hypothetical protein
MADTMFGNIAESEKNPTVNWIDDFVFSHKPGKISISNRNADKSSAIVITDSGVTITNEATTGGLTVSDRGVAIQGTLTITSKGESVKKAEYSENPRSMRIFTYTETVSEEAIPKEIASEVAGAAGINTSVGVAGTQSSVGMDGILPLVTGPAIGVEEAHFHIVVTPHVHRIEPAYLYRIPSVLTIFSGAIGELKGFFGPSTFQSGKITGTTGARG